MFKKISAYLFFVLIAAAVVLSLKLAGWAPLAIDSGLMRQYTSIDEARSRLHLTEVYVPAYLPQELVSWPPSLVIAGKDPYVSVLMEFRGKTGPANSKKGVYLLITQSASKDFSYPGPLDMKRITESTTYNLKGKPAKLEVGFCRDGAPCSRVSWEEGGYHMLIAARTGPFELLRIAGSMSPSR